MTDPAAMTEAEKAKLVQHYQAHLDWKETPSRTTMLMTTVENHCGAKVHERLVEWEYVLNQYGMETTYKLYGSALQYVCGQENAVLTLYGQRP